MRCFADIASQEISCPILITHTTDDEVINENHFTSLTSILRERRDASKESVTEVAERFTVTRLPANAGEGELITWRGPAGNHSNFVGTEVIIDMLGEIMHL